MSHWQIAICGMVRGLSADSSWLSVELYRVVDDREHMCLVRHYPHTTIEQAMEFYAQRGIR